METFLWCLAGGSVCLVAGYVAGYAYGYGWVGDILAWFEKHGF